MWAYWNKEMDKYIPCHVRMEDFIYALPVGHNPTEKNSDLKHQEPWSEEMEETFERICGDLNRSYGYPDTTSNIKGIDGYEG